VQVDPIKPTMKAPGTKRLKLEYDETLSDFAFKFKLCRYMKVSQAKMEQLTSESLTMHDDAVGRGLHSSTFQLNLSRVGHTSPCPPV